MTVSFSKEYNVSNDIIEKTKVFDTILTIDSRVFIDPALLELCDIEIFKNARKKVENYFSNIIVLLKNSKIINDMYWKKADKLLKFTEITGSCIGYSSNSTNGNGIGPELRKNILCTAKELIDKGVDDPVLFELLGVFQDKVGCDRISDLLTFILRDEIFQYTKMVLAEAHIPTVEVSYNRDEKYHTCINQYNDKPLLLLPISILSSLPIAETFYDIDNVCYANNKVRDTINEYFNFNEKNTRLTKTEIFKMMLHSNDFVKCLLSSYKSMPKKQYNFNNDVFGEYIWYKIASEYTENYKLYFHNTKPKNMSDIKNIVDQICEKFKVLIEDNGLYKLLYNENKETKRESAAQLVFFGIASSYCEANNLDLTREGNNGRGPVDFKLSRGIDKILVEVKLTSNNQLLHGITTQLPIYMRQENTKKAIYLIIDNGHPKRLKQFIDLYNTFTSEQKEKISYIIIDATFKESASKAKDIVEI